ncbi:hypothetical protein [Streptomyces sp. CoT10]|uniref:hypothetical protein n=1 Tax=Streptomyces sp. CoT10 TaxID=2875762 RepID=UPI001CD36B11|nr:hypothetical protein [Streptomyces sp. CoT10]
MYAEKKKTAPSVAEARRELGQQTVTEYAKQWRPRQRRMTEYSTGWHVDSSINVHIIPRLGSRKLNSVTPIVVERFLDELETDGVGRGNQVNIFRVLKAILRDAYGKGAMKFPPDRGQKAAPRLEGGSPQGADVWWSGSLGGSVASEAPRGNDVPTVPRHARMALQERTSPRTAGASRERRTGQEKR